jgi:hypothetical protein
MISVGRAPAGLGGETKPLLSRRGRFLFDGMAVEHEVPKAARQQVFARRPPGCDVIEQHAGIVLLGIVRPHVHHRYREPPQQVGQPRRRARAQRQDAVVLRGVQIIQLLADGVIQRQRRVEDPSRLRARSAPFRSDAGNS